MSDGSNGEGKYATYHQILLLCDLDKAMTRVLILCDAKARRARIEIRTVQAFVTITLNPRVAKVAGSIVQYRRRRGLGRRASWASCLCRLRAVRVSFTGSTVDVVNHDPPRLLDLVKLVEGVVELGYVLQAARAEIIICAHSVLPPEHD
jgi:hypothetical protein